MYDIVVQLLGSFSGQLVLAAGTVVVAGLTIGGLWWGVGQLIWLFQAHIVYPYRERRGDYD